MTTSTKSVDPRVRRTRQLLQQAIMELLEEKGFSSMTIQDITERATVNRATFYAHFEDKYALMDSIIREQFQLNVTNKLPNTLHWNTSTLRTLIQGVFDFLTEIHSHQCHSNSTKDQFEPMLDRAVQQELYTLLLSRLKQVGVSTGRPVPAETTAEVISWAIFGAASRWSRQENRFSTEQMVSHVLTIITEGIMRLSPSLLKD